MNHEITILRTEQDIRRACEIWNSSYIQKHRRFMDNVVLITLVVSVAATAFCTAAGQSGSVFLSDAETGRTFFRMLPVDFLAVAAFYFILYCLRKKVCRRTAEKREAAELARFSRNVYARSYSFCDNGIRTRGRYSDFIIEYGTLRECHEFSDGLFFLYNVNMSLWMPARFFDSETAAGVTEKMKEIFGRRYYLHSEITVPETPETAEAENTAEPSGEVVVSSRYTLKKRDILHRVAAGIGSKKILIALLSIAGMIFMAAETVKWIICSADRFKAAAPEELLSAAAVSLLGTVIFVPFCLVFGAYVFNIVYYFVMSFRNLKPFLDEVQCDYYEDMIINRLSSGKTVYYWNKIDAMTFIGSDLLIYSGSVGATVVPESELRKDNSRLLRFINEKTDSKCDHGNDNKHDNDRDCDCGHGNDHGNDHDCDCGHDHDHGNDHDCDCGHDHGNAHGCD